MIRILDFGFLKRAEEYLSWYPITKSGNFPVRPLAKGECMKSKTAKGIGLAILAAALYALNAPFSKLLLQYVPPILMAGILYLGAGLGMAAILMMQKISHHPSHEAKLTRKELPYTIAMIALDIFAPILLMCGLTMTSAANASLLNNFEITATALIALLLFHEKISPRLWAGIILVTFACMLLSFEGASSLRFSQGSLLVLLAACCWGLENNCTRKLSAKDPLEIVLLKGFFSGGASLLVGLMVKEQLPSLASIGWALLLGFAAYGLSIYFYVYAQRLIGAARTSAYYAIAPFISAILSLIVFRQIPPSIYLIALAVMAAGAWLCADD